MKNRLIITISDVRGTRAFNVHQIAKKLILIIVLVIACIIGGAFWFIGELNDQMDNLKIEKQKEIEQKDKEIKLREDEIGDLNTKEKQLQAQNQFYSMQIQGKVEDIEALTSKLDNIEEMIGLRNEEEKMHEITKETRESIDQKLKMYMLTTIPNGVPLKDTRITSHFGYRIHPITKKKTFHKGIDLKASRKTPIYTTADGIVSFVENKDLGGFGRVVKIQHNFGFQTVYAHLNKINVKVGDVVRKNQEIGLSGNSGRSTAPHLHYEIRFGSMVLNPREFLRWNLDKYDDIFKKERRIQWESLVKLISEQYKMVQQL